MLNNPNKYEENLFCDDYYNNVSESKIERDRIILKIFIYLRGMTQALEISKSLLDTGSQCPFLISKRAYKKVKKYLANQNPIKGCIDYGQEIPCSVYDAYFSFDINEPKKWKKTKIYVPNKFVVGEDVIGVPLLKEYTTCIHGKQSRINIIE